MIFVVVDGTPSIGQMVMVGNGRIGQQSTSRQAALPPNAGWGLAALASNAATTASNAPASTAVSGILAAPSAAADAQLAVSSASKLSFGFLSFVAVITAFFV